MKRTIGAILGLSALWLLLVGSTDCVPTGQKGRTEIFTLKSIKELFARPKVLAGLVRGGFFQTAVAEDPHCPPGFQRGPRGHCREVW